MAAYARGEGPVCLCNEEGCGAGVGESGRAWSLYSLTRTDSTEVGRDLFRDRAVGSIPRWWKPRGFRALLVNAPRTMPPLFSTCGRSGVTCVMGIYATQVQTAIPISSRYWNFLVRCLQTPWLRILEDSLQAFFSIMKSIYIYSSFTIEIIIDEC